MILRGPSTPRPLSQITYDRTWRRKKRIGGWYEGRNKRTKCMKCGKLMLQTSFKRHGTAAWVEVGFYLLRSTSKGRI